MSVRPAAAFARRKINLDSIPRALSPEDCAIFCDDLVPQPLPPQITEEELNGRRLNQLDRMGYKPKVFLQKMAGYDILDAHGKHKVQQSCNQRLARFRGKNGLLKMTRRNANWLETQVKAAVAYYTLDEIMMGVG